MTRRRSTTVAEVAAMPEADLRFRDFAALRSGRDAYSTMSTADLRAAVGIDAADCIESEIDDPASYASALRWMLRGLPIAPAIRKARTDAQISANAVQAKLTSARHDRELEAMGIDPWKYR